MQQSTHKNKQHKSKICMSARRVTTHVPQQTQTHILQQAHSIPEMKIRNW